jgi:hypothetical protein
VYKVAIVDSGGVAVGIFCDEGRARNYAVYQNALDNSGPYAPATYRPYYEVQPITPDEALALIRDAAETQERRRA